MKTAPIWSGSNHRTIHYILANDLPTLVWIANLASIELHPSLSLAADIATPTMIVFDLDPGPPANIVQCAQVGLWVREIFDHFGLRSFPKTSGSKGLQIYVPLNTQTGYEQTKSFAHAVARLLEQEHPELVVSDMKKAVRTNKVFVDWSQNDEHKTTISVYSLRAREHPTVSTPVTWDEVEQALKKKDAARLVFEAKDVLARVEKMGDLFEPVQKLKQKLPQLAGLRRLTSQKDEEEGRATKASASPPAAKAQTRPKKATKKTKGKSRRGKASHVIIPADMAHLYVGTSGWAYPTWKPAFYPEKLAQKKFLNFYASKLNAVEVNYTFRQLVKETTVQNWIAETPEHFRFTIKAHQVLTHIKRLKNSEEFLQRFLGTLEALERAKRLGPLLFQLPPNFKVDQAVLAEFSATLAANRARGVRVPPRILVHRSHLEHTARAQHRALRGRNRRARHSRRSHRRLRLLPLPQTHVHGRRAQDDGRAHSGTSGCRPRCLRLLQA